MEHRFRLILRGIAILALVMLESAMASGWYSPGQAVPYGSYPGVPYGSYPPANYGYPYPYGEMVAPNMVQPPPVVLNLPNQNYYYALPSGVVLNPAQPVVVPYPVYYEDPYANDTASPPPQPAQAAAAKGRFAVLAGSFLEEDLAKLSERYIQALGYTCYRQQIKVKDKNFIRIFAGPFPKKTEATEASKQMQAKYNMPGVVVPFRP